MWVQALAIWDDRKIIPDFCGACDSSQGILLWHSMEPFPYPILKPFTRRTKPYGYKSLLHFSWGPKRGWRSSRLSHFSPAKDILGQQVESEWGRRHGYPRERGQRMPEQLPPAFAAPMMKPHLPRIGPRQIELKEGRDWWQGTASCWYHHHLQNKPPIY